MAAAVQKAFDFPYHSPRWEMQMFQPLVEQFGGKILSDDGKTAYLNSPEAVKALTLWRDVTRVTGDPRTTMNTPSNPNQDFIDGRGAMWITGPWATPQVQASPIKNDFTVVGFPQVDPQKHKPKKRCVSCHDPHDPVPPRVPQECSACHGQIERTKALSSHALIKCTACHEVGKEHKVSPRSSTPTKPQTRAFCGTCHAEGSPNPEVPKVDMAEHGGSYLCWQCHYAHLPEGS